MIRVNLERDPALVTSACLGGVIRLTVDGPTPSCRVIHMPTKMTSEEINDFRRRRGPRYAVTWSVNTDMHEGTYTDTAELAEKVRAIALFEGHCYNVHVSAPEGSVDLAALGDARLKAKRAFDEATAFLRAGVLRALEDGRSESEVARSARVDRMTVRTWAGKR
jgi:hypothetical protein